LGLTAPDSRPPAPDDEVIRAVQALRAGQVVAIPTDTVYGLAAAIDRHDAIEQLYSIKGRPAEKAIPILISEAGHVDRLTARLSAPAAHLARELWPGALTLVLPALPGLPQAVTTINSSGTETVAVRVPDHALARSIIAGAGGALAVTSANRSGAAPAVEAEEVRRLGLPPTVFVVDGGRAPGGAPSTIVDATTETPEILREGAIPTSAIAAALANVEPSASTELRARYDLGMSEQQGRCGPPDVTP